MTLRQKKRQEPNELTVSGCVQTTILVTFYEDTVTLAKAIFFSLREVEKSREKTNETNKEGG